MPANVSLAVLYSADFNEDGSVDNTDLTLWKAGFGTTDASRLDGDANGDSTG